MHAGATQYRCFIHARVRIRRVANLVGAEAVLKLRVLRSQPRPRCVMGLPRRGSTSGTTPSDTLMEIARPVSKPPSPPRLRRGSQVALAVPLAEAPWAVDEEEPHPSEFLLHSRGRANNLASCQLSSPNHYSSINFVGARRHDIGKQLVLSGTHCPLADDDKSAAHHLEVMTLALELRPSVQAGRLLAIAPRMHRLTVPVVVERLPTGGSVVREKALGNNVIELA